MKIKLYIDFDGVILNTIDITYKMFDKLKINNITEKNEFYKKLNWEELLESSTPINNSIDNLKLLIESNLYDVIILSHVISEQEALVKKKYIKKNIPELEIITVNRDTNKCDAVDCKNAILVDDYMGNLDLWYAKGGIPIKFSDKGRKYNYITITSLDMMIDKYEEIKDLVSLKQ